jgi:cytochrome c-type biogenesis protein CcmF
MIMIGQLCLLSAFVAVGYAAFACVWGARWERRTLLRTGLYSAVGGMFALTVVMVVLVWALLVKDFSFHYVAQYSSRLLPWHYSFSALWVGQAGSLLLWTWMLGLLALVFRFWPRKQRSALRDPAFGILMAYCCFLTATMVFAADPMEANIAPGEEGAGLSPLLQHPAMLIHPPIIFLGYATWAVPCALAIAALLSRRLRVDDHEHSRALPQPLSPPKTPLDSTWVRIARPWALVAWTVLGGGILLGAYWSYEELGWGGYWAWDPVENGSLIPWLIGTAFIHALMAWQYRGILKKTSVALAIASFGMCNFATFLTRSGIFSSLHAFSQSPIGWLFLGLMLMLGVGGAMLIVRHRECLMADNLLTSIWSREALIIISMVTLLLLSVVTVAGTLSVALSEAIVGRRIMVGPEFYNHVLMPIGLVLLATMAAAPLLRWGAPPLARQKQALLVSAAAALVPVLAVWLSGVRHPLALAVAWLAACSVATHVASPVIESWQRNADRPWRGLPSTLVASRRLYASFMIHLGFACIVVGVTGSSLGSRRHELVMKQGEVVEWAGRSIRFQRLIQRQLPDKFIVEAELEISRDGAKPFRLLPAQHLHRLQDQWTTEVAIRSTWGGDFYTILHNGEGRDAVRLTLVENPLMRWMWFGGWVIAASAGIRLWPSRRRVAGRPQPPVPVQQRHSAGKKRRELATASA